MVSKKFWFGILVIVPAFGMMVIGCDNDSTSNEADNGSTGNEADDFLNGIWVSDSIDPGETKLYNGSYEWTNSAGVLSEKGTYIFERNEITFTATHHIGSSFYGFELEEKFYTKDEVKDALQMTDEEFEELLRERNWLFSISTADYFPNEDKFVYASGVTYIRL